MSDTKFTPGPWRVEPHTVRISIVNPQAIRKGPHGGGGRLIAYTPVAGDSVQAPIALANANLIAAAPDMFEALENLLNVVRSYVSTHDDLPGIDFAETALRKARGETL